METNTLLSFENLIDAVGGSLIGSKNSSFGFSSVAIDSRECVKNSLFVPLIGSVQNGHIYIKQALENGASVVFVANSELKENKTNFENLAKEFDATFIAVENTMTALQKAAKRYVEQFPSLIKIGVTGSSGKTTTKEIIASVLSQKYSVVTNQGNLNSETGLPLSVFKIRSEHEVGIFEMGMNRRGEIAEIASVLFPSIAVITNIGTAHIGILGTQDAIAEEKKNIFSNFSDNCIGFVPENDKYASFLQKVKKGRVEKYGIKSNRRIREVSSSGLDGTTFEYDGVFIRFPVPGKHNFSNALAAISVAEYLHLSTAEIKKGLESVKTIFGRSQIYRGEKTLVHDCYNANPDSMESAISFCDDLEWKGEKIYVLGDMLELGEQSKKLHTELGEKAAKSDADYVVFYGNEMKYAYEACKNKKRSFWSDKIQDITEELETAVCNGDLVLLKASKGMELWRAADALKIKLGGHA